MNLSSEFVLKIFFQERVKMVLIADALSKNYCHLKVSVYHIISWENESGAKREKIKQTELKQLNVIKKVKQGHTPLLWKMWRGKAGRDSVADRKILKYIQNERKLQKIWAVVLFQVRDLCIIFLGGIWVPFNNYNIIMYQFQRGNS